MLKRTSLIILVLVAAGLVGCTENVTQPESDDVENIEAVITSSDSLFGVDTFFDEDTLFFGEETMHRGPGLRSFLPRFFRHRVEKFSRDVSVELIESDSAVASIASSVSGTVYIGINSVPENETRVDTVWKKPFTINTIQKAKFARIELPGFRFRNRDVPRWRVVALTPLVGTAEESDLLLENLVMTNRTTEEVLEIESALDRFLDREDAPRMRWGDEVELTVGFGNGDESGETALARLHSGPFRGMRPMRLEQDESSQTYSGSFQVRPIRIMGRLMVNLIDDDVFSEPSAPYNTVFWHVPFLHGRIGPGQASASAISKR